MPVHHKDKLARLEAELVRRHASLLDAIRGRSATQTEGIAAESFQQVAYSEEARVVDPQAVRLAIDDFGTILKEIGRQLSK